ncbi:hypothetical protein F4054_00730 [Candidatus Poribacteria bacterium]|nr:hypothetical protein [Candidatus Poribacteria bacterium]MYG09220.1 hypothetical protein [Candidatus Poribacteria bacterium]MYK20766.1 hypothetical protein [Candidatus Poribacteria bacterium]
MNLVEFSVIFFFSITAFNIFVLYLDSKNDQARVEALEARLAEARAEVRHLKSPAAKRNGTAQSTPASLKVSSETETQTPAVHAPDDTDVSTSDDTVEVVHTGPLKGLPLDVAKAIHEEYTAASIARAKRYDEWYQQWQAHRERDRTLVKKELARADAVLADSKKSRENSLAFFALMSPEELEAARKEALKTQTAEAVDLFFRQVAEFGPAKTLEQIEQDAQSLKENRVALAQTGRALETEREEITLERDELQRTKPLPPNLGLDEFYTEWKKRNSTKPTPP